MFVNATEDIAEVEAKLNHLGLTAAALYGDADKVTRSNVLARFRDGKLKVLVASDVAARGLDIENLSLVVSFDPAFDSDHYVHRAGRTGRMGRRGLSVTIVTEQQTFIMRKFAKELDIALEERQMVGGKVLPAGESHSSWSGGRGRGDGKRSGGAPRSGKPPVRTAEAGARSDQSAARQAPGSKPASAVRQEIGAKQAPGNESGERRETPRSASPAAGARSGAISEIGRAHV